MDFTGQTVRKMIYLVSHMLPASQLHSAFQDGCHYNDHILLHSNVSLDLPHSPLEQKKYYNWKQSKQLV